VSSAFAEFGERCSEAVAAVAWRARQRGGGSRDFGGISQLGRMPTMAARGMAVKNAYRDEGRLAVK
jgi:hypothetical protein